MTKKFKIKLRAKMLGIFISILVVLSTWILVIVYTQIHTLEIKNINTQLDAASQLGFSLLNQKYPGDWKVDGDKLYKGDKLLNGDTDLVDLVKKNTGNPATIFLNDTRVSTNVQKEDGSRAVGTKVSSAIAAEVLTRGNTYIGEAVILNSVYQAKYVPIKDASGKTIGIWFVGVEKASINATIFNLMIIIAMITLVVLAISIVAVILFVNSMKKGINAISNTLSEIERGDLTKVCVVKTRDELGEIADSVNSMVINLKDLVEKIQTSAKKVDSSSDGLTEISNEMTRVSENIADSIQDVAGGTGLQAGEMMNSTVLLNNFGDEIDSIVNEILYLNQSSASINVMATDSNSDMTTLINSIKKVKKAFQDFAERFSTLGIKLNKINEITQLINDVSDKTNLLALNAAIEAARAGEAGRGFSVVADEIRKLAEQSKVSSHSINEVINNITSENAIIMSSTEVMKTEIDEQVSVINSAAESFKGILLAVGDVLPKIKGINDSIVKINLDKNIITEKIESSSSVAEEISASSEEIAAASEELNAASEEVSGTAHALNSMTKELIDISKGFKI